MFVASLIMSQAIFLCCNVKVKVETRLATDMIEFFFLWHRIPSSAGNN